MRDYAKRSVLLRARFRWCRHIGTEQAIGLGLGIWLKAPDARREKSLGPADHLVFDFFFIQEPAKAPTLDDGIVDKNILSVIVNDEAEALFRIKPLDLTDWHPDTLVWDRDLPGPRRNDTKAQTRRTATNVWRTHRTVVRDSDE